MSADHLVSIIIPVYNRTQYLGAAIESVLAQSLQDFEIIMVDDGSSADVRTVIVPYLDRVRYLRHPENKGLAAARNTGIRNSTGQYLAFLDDDDLFEAEKIAAQSLILNREPDCGLVYSDALEFTDDNTSVTTINLTVGRSESPEKFPQLFFMNPNVRIPAVLIRKRCFEDVGMFDETLAQHEDGDMLLRIALKWKVRFSEYTSAKVRNTPQSMSKDRAGMYRSIIKSSEAILATHPEFVCTLASSGPRRLAELHFLLGRVLFREFRFAAAFNELRASRRASNEYLRPYLILNALKYDIWSILRSLLK